MFNKIKYIYIVSFNSNIKNIIIMWLTLKEFFLIVASDMLNDEINLILENYDQCKIIYIILQGDWELYQNCKIIPFENLFEFEKFIKQSESKWSIKFILTSTIKESVNKLVKLIKLN